MKTIKVIKLNYKKTKNKTKKKTKNKTNAKRIKQCDDYIKPVNFIFGYGSLINSYSRKYTGKGFIGSAIPVELSKKAGYKRIWTCKKSKYGNYSFLGLTKDKNPHNINGILTPIYKCIRNFDKREKGYKRIKIKYDPKRQNVIKALSWQKMPNYPCNIYIYTVKKELNNMPNKDCPISQNYVDVVMSGCLEYGNEFCKKFLKNTFNWRDKDNKINWKNDRKINTRRWVKNNNKKNRIKIDKLLKKYIPKIYKDRH